jgi:hypothetical protein
MEHQSRHQCLIYEGPPSHKLHLLAVILKRKLEEGYQCLYLNSAPMVAGMRSTLAAMGVNVEKEIAGSRILLSSETISAGEEFNCEVMLAKLEDTLNEALNDGYKGLWASGDMSWEFGPTKNFSKLLEYEWRLEALFRRRKEIHGICQYHRDTLPREVMRQGLLSHSDIVINDTLSRINPHYLKSPQHTPISATTHELDKIIDVLCQC